MKKFKTKKKRRLLKLIIYLLFVGISFKITINYLNKDIRINPEKYIKYLVNEGFNNQIKDFKESSISPISLIENNLDFNHSINLKNNDTIKYIEKVNNIMDEPLIYIYNSHDEEEYKLKYKYEYSVIPSVKLASYILQEKLDSLNIKSIAQVESIKSILESNNWIYKDSYKASRLLLEKSLKDNPTLKYFIDIHRDSSNYNKTTLNYNNKVYAKIMFIVGLEHDNYEYNLSVASKINDYINSIIPGISRGIYKKEGPGVNGVYNQDFSPNLILVEVGGQDNTIEEVSNTINVLGEALSMYIKGDINNEEKA